MFDRALGIVLSLEGMAEIVRDPNDPGGTTKYGIAQRWAPMAVEDLTLDDAVAYYRSQYWDRYKCGELPWPFALAVFDGVVNQSGLSTIKRLQRSLGVLADGIIGPQTVGMARRANTRTTLARFLAKRAKRYGVDEQFERYGEGWMHRLFTIHQHALEG
jgi:lysozyme family protein